MSFLTFVKWFNQSVHFNCSSRKYLPEHELKTHLTFIDRLYLIWRGLRSPRGPFSGSKRFRTDRKQCLPSSGFGQSSRTWVCRIRPRLIVGKQAGKQALPVHVIRKTPYYLLIPLSVATRYPCNCNWCDPTAAEVSLYVCVYVWTRMRSNIGAMLLVYSLCGRNERVTTLRTFIRCERVKEALIMLVQQKNDKKRSHSISLSEHSWLYHHQEAKTEKTKSPTRSMNFMFRLWLTNRWLRRSWQNLLRSILFC